MAEAKLKGGFPSQAVSDSEKNSYDYGLKIARAIEDEWFKGGNGGARFYANADSFHRLRLYARGEQDVQKYKDELSINGDLSYLNLDWKPVPIIPKFVDIVVNGISDRTYDITAYSQDPFSIKEKTDYVAKIVSDMKNKELLNAIQQEFGMNLYNTDVSKLPESNEELQLHMQLDYKQPIEIAEEEAINNVLDHNKYSLIKKRCEYDLTVIGIGANKTSFNTSDGIKTEYVDPANIIYSHTESPYFDDLYYVGEVKRVSITDLKKQFPELTEDDIEEIEETRKSTDYRDGRANTFGALDDYGYVDVLYFEYKTFNNQVYKIKETSSGGYKAIKKDDSFNPPKDTRSRFEKTSRTLEVLYCGVKIVGLNSKILKWELAENMTRPKSDTTKVNMSYNIVAPRMYDGKIESLVGRMTSFADSIQITHLKLQQILAKMAPDGIYIDVDGIAEIDLGNGTNYNPAEALNMFFQTGSIVGRSMTQDGEFNHGKSPIQETATSGGYNKIGSLVNTYNHYMQMLRDVTGLNEARDGSMPDANALVGLQKMAAANSNTATRHILQSGLYITLKTAEAIALRISDVLKHSNTKRSFISGIGKFNVGTLEEISKLHLHDFGIFLQLSPDDEEKQILENNIQVALKEKQIHLEDAIDIREVKNIKLANQLLKLRRRKKQEEDRMLQLENIKAQTESNTQSAQAAAAAEMQKEQALAEVKAQLEQVKGGIEINKLEREAEIKKELMQWEFNLNMRLKEVELQVINDKEDKKEDRKDQRTKIQATQQSELIEQRQSGTGPKNFESAGFDSLGGFGLEQFDPR